MPARLLVLNGHPDPSSDRFCHALAADYARGATAAGAELRWIDIGNLDFDFLRSEEEHEKAAVPDSLAEAQEAIAWATHILIVFPLWLGTMPALLKAFLEHVLRPGFAYHVEDPERPGTVRMLKGRSVRVIVTMGMPGFFYRYFYCAHGVRVLERSILRFMGMGPVRTTLIGSVKGMSEEKRRRWLDRARELGRRCR